MDIGNPSARSPAYVATRDSFVHTSGTSADPRGRERAGRILAESVVRTTKVEPVGKDPRRKQPRSDETQKPKNEVSARIRALFASLKSFPADVKIVQTMRELAANALRDVTGGPEVESEREARKALPTTVELEAMLRASERLDNHESFLTKLGGSIAQSDAKDHPDAGFLLDVTG